MIKKKKNGLHRIDLFVVSMLFMASIFIMMMLFLCYINFIILFR